MNHQFKRILDLVRRTGDRMIVTDPDGEETYVVMGLDQYEAILFKDKEEDDDEEDDEMKVDWKPEDYGDLVPTEGVNRPDDLKEAVEHDLAILEAWRDETEGSPEAVEPTKSEKKPKSDDEDRFYLEPVE